ncbi:MAG: hypothetical protein HZB38_00795 [Planctomycetes bacterium]|nr:hypothetical protein [Planctomycetota bacterium]
MILATAMPPHAGIASGLAVLAFCLLLADVWWQQRHRRRVWITAPQQLLTQPAGAGLGATASVGAALLAAALSAASYGSAGAPFAAGITSLTLLGAGHLLINPLVGAAGRCCWQGTALRRRCQAGSAIPRPQSRAVSASPDCG